MIEAAYYCTILFFISFCTSALWFCSNLFCCVFVIVMFNVPVCHVLALSNASCSDWFLVSYVMFLLVHYVEVFLVSHFCINSPHVFIVGLLCIDVVNRCQRVQSRPVQLSSEQSSPLSVQASSGQPSPVQASSA